MSRSTLQKSSPQPDSRLATQQVTSDLIAYIVEKIVGAISPRKVFLFGSYSRGQQTESSDLDLLVVQDSGRSCRQVRREIELLLWGRRFPVDLIVASLEQVQRNVADGNPFYTQHILTEGKVLYDRML
jgi:predicted nucleotidyltransferase